MDRIELLERLKTRFNDNELRELCYTLGVPYEDLPGEGHAAKALELILYLERRERVSELEAACLRERALPPGKAGTKTQHSAQPKRPKSGNQPRYDVFLAHNSADKPQVEQICRHLNERGIKTWLDKEQIRPGDVFQREIQTCLNGIGAAAIFLGPHGVGKWQALEVDMFIGQCVDAGLRVIPVLLPGVDKIPDDMAFLRRFSQVQFKDVGDQDALDNLAWGITGKRD